ncbi:DUF7527 domain-containing protein [Halorubrum sp. DTA46]|uniref:DUF7527 domain-containing protein n=1 Tax=Halorubrum sp. DTA46 TaxID=3402162 RepID=UPI003AAFFCB4
MDAQRRTEITEWDAREFSGGFSGLRPLADRGFSGAVTDGMGWLFLFDGRVVGTADADLDAFADASGTVYEAPHESLPVLFAMQEQGGEPRAQYYTNDTPLSEADRKLSRGGFTGYIELSENVLSGDYYVTYTAGESMAAAYVGNSRRLETGDDAFALADDEVGIYTVYEVDVTVREIPSDTDDTSSGGERSTETGTDTDGETAPSGTDAAASSGTAEDGVTGADEVTGTREVTGTDEVRDAAEATGAEESERIEADPSESAGDDPVAVDDADDADDAHDAHDADQGGQAAEEGERTREPEADPAYRETADAAAVDATAIDAAASRHDESAGVNAGPSPREADDISSAESDDRGAKNSDGGVADDDVFSEEEQWREQKSIPALDPSEASDPPGQGSESNADRSDANTSAAGDDRNSPEPRATGRRSERRSAVSQTASETQKGSGSERLRQLERSLDEAQSERESLKAERDAIAAERDEIAEDLDALERELESLRSERDRLREELSQARTRLPDGERTISPSEARSGTNLFVRYDSKGGATLEDAHDGAIDRDALRENLQIEHHTSFETDGLLVDGRPYEEFLRETIEYGFTRWLVEDLPFEVSSTGNQSVLRDLYDAIPEIDRAEIAGSVSITIRENGEEMREQRTFDLVLRDRMGNPLFVADLNDSRDPTAEGTLESLVSNGRDIAESNDSFAAAFAVTESFFEPGALETASDAVGGGLFSRSKRSSFVKLSRKQGYHLCLVEARDGGFHMTVPDL